MSRTSIVVIIIAIVVGAVNCFEYKETKYTPSAVMGLIMFCFVWYEVNRHTFK